MFLDYFALAVLVIVVLVIFYGVIVIHDIPYEMAVERNHPHQDAGRDRTLLMKFEQADRL